MWLTKSGFVKPLEFWSFEVSWLGTCRLQITLFRTFHHLAVSSCQVDHGQHSSLSPDRIKVNPRICAPLALLDAISYLSRSLQIHAVHLLCMCLSVLSYSSSSLASIQKFRTACFFETSFSKLPWAFFFSSRRISESVCKFFEKSHWEFDCDFTEFID